MPHPFLIVSQSDYLIKIVDLNSHAEWQTVQILISWLLQKPTVLELHCLHRQGISGLSRTRVKSFLWSLSPLHWFKKGSNLLLVQKHWWLIYCGLFELVFESLGNSQVNKYAGIVQDYFLILLIRIASFDYK